MGGAEKRGSRRIAVTAVAGAGGGDFHGPVDVQGLVHEDRVIAVPGRVDVCVAAAGSADRSGSRKSCWNRDGWMSTRR